LPSIIIQWYWCVSAPSPSERSREGIALSARVPEHVVQQIAQSTDLVGLIGRYCNLKKRGKSFWGLCPFHKEKTPSFKVDPESGLYFCFGCKEAGNVFTFLKKVEGLEFNEALERLARDAGVDLSQYRIEGGPSRSELGQLREVVELATAFYAKCLRMAKGAEHAREYLKARQINDESVARWRLGYAPDGWEHFLELARGRGYEPRALESAGLVVQRTDSDGHYDRFRNRLMFPISDRSGRGIGFGARALNDEDQPKYLNSPEGPLFSKGRCFYGFSEAREAIRTEKTAVIVEGYTDVIMAHQFGVAPVMAVLGTALTEDHARGLKALCERVVLVFDADEAGQASATRSIEVLLGEDMDVRVATLPPGEDPCDFLLSGGAEAFRSRLDAAEDFLQFRLRRAREAYDTATVTGRSRAFDELAQLAGKVTNEARRDMLIRSIAEEFGLGSERAVARAEYLCSRGRPARTDGQAADKGLDKIDDQAMALQLLGVLLKRPELQGRAANELDTGELHDSREKDLLHRLLKSGPMQMPDFVTILEDSALCQMVATAVFDEEWRQRRTALDAVTFYEGLRDRLSKRRKDEEREHIRQLSVTTTTTPAPEMPHEEPTITTTPAPEVTTSAAVPTQEELLREYEARRREQDKKSARINPRRGAI